jgi:hypothetical protein
VSDPDPFAMKTIFVARRSSNQQKDYSFCKMKLVPPRGGDVAFRDLPASFHIICVVIKLEGCIVKVSFVREKTPEYVVVPPEPMIVKTPRGILTVPIN